MTPKPQRNILLIGERSQQTQIPAEWLQNKYFPSQNDKQWQDSGNCRVSKARLVDLFNKLFMMQITRRCL